VDSDFVLAYQLTPFWRFNLRRLKFNYRRVVRFLQIDPANDIFHAVNYEDAEKSETLEHMEIRGISASHVELLIDFLKRCYPKLKSLKVKE